MAVDDVVRKSEKDVVLTANDIIAQIEAKDVILTIKDKIRIRKGYDYAKKSQAGQYRLSGEPYFEGHCIPAVEIMVDRLEEITDAAYVDSDKLLDSVIALLNHHIYSQKDGQELIGNLQENLGLEVAMRIDFMRDRNGNKTYALELAQHGDRYMAAMLLANSLHNVETAEYLPKPRIQDMPLRIEPYIALAERLDFNSYASDLRKGIFRAAEFVKKVDSQTPSHPPALILAVTDVPKEQGNIH